ncbi:MAG TPA: hypothetical protein VGX68_04660 [Thermoanaerobaculia bacterium]|nr:hypothetical protein [Thermoanaerobaculia bacterium]
MAILRPTGPVTMVGAGGNTIGGCAAGVAAAAIPALDVIGMTLLIGLIAGAGLFVMRFSA